MNYCLIIPDGMADNPVRRLDGKTPMEAARIPNMDRAAREGMLGLVRTVPARMEPGSSVAMMSIMGYDPRRCYTGRAPLEAADMGIEMAQDDWAFRCNLVTLSDDILADYAAGHITTEEAALLIAALNETLGSEEITFHTGTSYRHIMLYKGAEDVSATTVPPHNVVGQTIKKNLPRGKGSRLLIDLIERSADVLSPLDVNVVRADLGQNPANLIWLWGQGRKAALESFEENFGVRGAAISAVNLVRGMARLIGWEIIDVPGATGYVDTDYAAKGDYALEALTRFDLVLVHVEAPDEASHQKDLKAKLRAIEQIDRHVVGPIMSRQDVNGGLRVLVMPDHLTTLERGVHENTPVPFALWGEGVAEQSGLPLTEASGAATGIKISKGHRLMETLLGA